MNNSSSIVIFLTLAITVICGGFVYIYMKVSPDARKAVQCKNDVSSISFLIDDEAKSVTMAGKIIDSTNITVINETAVAMDWTNKTNGTKVFLDRIAGSLEIETTNDLVNWDKEEMKCHQVSIRF